MADFWHKASSTGIHSLNLSFPNNAFSTDFVSTFRTAPWRAPRHLDFSIEPIDLWVVLAKPGMPQD
jgi:hypothetical protein